MANKLYFKYGVMNCGKSIELLKVAHNYHELNKNIILLKPSLDSRSKKGFIESRVCSPQPCIDIDKDNNICRIITNIMIENNKKIDCILIDECQFLTVKQVDQLVQICDNYDIPIMCYGLKNSYIKGELFPASQALLYYAEKSDEIKTLCHCGKKATMNLKISNGKPVYNGEIVSCGDIKNNSKDYYMPVCRYHYFNPIIDK